MLGAPFALAELASLSAWVTFGGLAWPDLPWYEGLAGESIAIVNAVTGAALTMLTWPYAVYVFLSRGTEAFLQSMFYLWY